MNIHHRTPSAPTAAVIPADLPDISLATMTRTMYAAIGAGDLAAARALLADDVVLHVPGTHPLAGDHHGPAGFAEFVIRSRMLTTTGERVELLDVLAGSNHAAAYCRVTAERQGRQPLDNTTVHILRFRESLVVEAWLHNWNGADVDRFWA